MKFGLSEEHLNVLKDILVRYDVKKVVVFGSRARGDYRERSDIDIAVYDSLSAGERAKLALDLRDSAIPIAVDIVFYDELTDKRFNEEIDKEGISLL